MNKFKKYKIDVSSKHKHLIENYLDEMKQHISDNNLDEELYEDIEQRVFEKLAIHKTLNDLLIKQVLQDIGSPEDIFEDEVSSSNTSFVGVIIGGIKKVFLNIKKGTKLIFATGVNIKNIAAFIKVFIIAVLNFIKKSILWGIKNIKTIIIWFIKNIKTLMIFVFGYAKKILFYAIKMLKKIFSLSGSIIGYGILLIALAGMVVLFLLYNGIVIGNVDYFANVPIELIFAYASILGALIILGIYFILKKGFLYHFLVFGICFVSVITFSIIGTTKIYNDHGFQAQYTEKFILESTDNNFTLLPSDVSLFGKAEVLNTISDSHELIVQPSKDDKIHVEVMTNLYTKDDETFQKLQPLLSPIEVNIEEGAINMDVLSGSLFIQKTALIPIERIITVSIPEGTIGNFGWGYQLHHQFPSCYTSYYNGFEILNTAGKLSCVKNEEQEYILEQQKIEALAEESAEKLENIADQKDIREVNEEIKTAEEKRR